MQGGVVVLMLALVLQVVNRNATRGLALEVGGAKRLHAVESLVSSIVLAPWALIVFFTREVHFLLYLLFLCHVSIWIHVNHTLITCF